MTLAFAGLPAIGWGETELQLVRGLAFNSSVLTQSEFNQAFHKILTELSQMVEDLLIDDGFQPKPEFLQVIRHLCLWEGFHVYFTMTIESANSITQYCMWMESITGQWMD